MYGRLKEIHKEMATYCFLLIALAPPIIVLTEAVEAISQSQLLQNKIVRNNKGREMRKYMNLSADPCQDFYAYACGNWANHNVQRRDEISSNLRKLEQQVQYELINLLEENKTQSDGTNGIKAKDFYKSCKEALVNGQRQQTFHSEVIKKHGGFPAAPGSNWALYSTHYDWVEIVGQLRYQYSMDILIGIDVVINPYNKLEYTILLTEPSTILPPDLCTAEGTNHIGNNRARYDRIEADIVTNLKNWLSLEQSEAVRVANSILVFEFELCTAMGASSEQLPRYDQINSTMNTLTKRSLYDWKLYFNDSIDFYNFIKISYGLHYAKTVAVRSERYFKHLIHTISIHDKATLANYIMYRAISMLSFPLGDNRQNRPKFCVEITKRFFPQVLGYMYYYKFANLPAKLKVEEMFTKIKFMFEHSFQNSWLAEGTSRIGVDKVRSIVLNFPTYEEKPNLQDLNIDVGHYWKNLNVVMSQLQQHERMRIVASENPVPVDEVQAYEVRMKYHYELGRIDLGWALLQPPYFQEVYPHAMLYAMIGQMLAQQLARAFDDVGWTSDVFNQRNWDHMTALQYNKRIECFRSQLSVYLSNNADSFQNMTELRELVTMSSGFNVAFAAYTNWLLYLHPINDFSVLSNETLTDVNFTNTQLFFITFAQMNCQHEEKKGIADECCPLQRHTLARYRVNGPLLNNLEFAKEFRCHIGRQMNVAEKCFIY